jgi:hypothetical protein
MIAWRTSRFLIYFFLILGSIVAMTAYAQYGNPVLFSGWRAFMVAQVSDEPTPTSVIQTPGVPIAGVHFPPVHVEVPSASPFDPGARPALYCDNCYVGF